MGIYEGNWDISVTKNVRDVSRTKSAMYISGTKTDTNVSESRNIIFYINQNAQNVFEKWRNDIFANRK